MSFHTLSNQLLDLRNDALHSLAKQMYSGLDMNYPGSDIDQKQIIEKLNTLYDRAVNKQDCLSELYREAEEFKIVKPLYMKPNTDGDSKVKINFKLKGTCAPLKPLAFP